MIPFTQFLRPEGRRREITIERSPLVEVKALAIIKRGFEFQVEELATGEVSLTIFDPSEEVDAAVEVVHNGPPVQEAIDRMIREFELA